MECSFRVLMWRGVLECLVQAILGEFGSSTVVPGIYLHQSEKQAGGSSYIAPISEWRDGAKRERLIIDGPGLNRVVESGGPSSMKVAQNDSNLEISVIKIHNNFI